MYAIDKLSHVSTLDVSGKYSFLFLDININSMTVLTMTGCYEGFLVLEAGNASKEHGVCLGEVCSTFQGEITATVDGQPWILTFS
jgi:hypothetical protein